MHVLTIIQMQIKCMNTGSVYGDGTNPNTSQASLHHAKSIKPKRSTTHAHADVLARMHNKAA
jgi:hypothetical protein